MAPRQAAVAEDVRDEAMAPPVPEVEDPKKRIVKFTIANLKDTDMTGAMIPILEFHYRPAGAPTDELPTKYKLLCGGEHVNEAPLEVVEFLKSRVYDKYENRKDPRTQEVYPVRVGSDHRFMVTIISG